MSHSEPLSRATLFAYAAPALPLAMLALPFYVLVPGFYAETLGLNIALVGSVLFGVRVLDALSDPAVGIFADRINPRMGRRRFLFALGTPLIMLGAWFTFAPPQGAGAVYLALWASVLSLATTVVQVPYAAWGAEISRSYEGRNRVVAWREALTVTGTLIALCMPALLPAFGITDPARVLQAIALLIVITLPLATLICLRVPEPINRSVVQLSFRDSFAALAANKPFLRLVLAFFVNGFANGLPATLFVFFVSERLQARDMVGPLLVLYFVSGIAGVPLWFKLAQTRAKHRVWCLGMMLAMAAFAFAPFLGAGDIYAFAIVTVLTGLALGADVVMPASLQADVIDVDTARSGEERSALYLSLWGLATKLSLAAAVGVAFPLLALAGFDPGQNIITPFGLDALAFLYAGLPVIVKIFAIALMWRFPVDRAAQQALRMQIEQRLSA